MLETVTIHAPDFDPALPWLGASAPVSLRALRGHVVLIDFFTSCCVNCMHVAPILHRLEARFAGEPVVVLGVHTGKFDHEQSPEVVRAAMDRMGIRHPVLVDEGMRTWHAFGVRSWPTLVVVRPDGTLAAVAPGEPDEAALHALVRHELDRGRARGHLASTPHDFLRDDHAPRGGLRFPSKVARSPRGLLAVSDTGHGRVLVWDGAGALVAVVAAAGHEVPPGTVFIEGPVLEPHGLAFADEETLVVCDARAHTIVAIELAAHASRVVAGTGRMGLAPLGFTPAPAQESALRSPWDLAVDGDRLLVALSGSHQIGVVDLRAGTVAALAGTGAESRLDGPGTEATFSQPNGLALVGGDLIVADSESSSLRVVRAATGETRTLLAGSLFTWGDEDGPLGVARMQHPMGLAYDGAHTLFVCDTYNGKLKAVDLEGMRVRTTCMSLVEPTGAVVLPGGDVIAATARGLVRVDPRGVASGFEAPVPEAPARRAHVLDSTEEPSGVVRFFDEVLVTSAPAGPGAVRLEVVVHAGGAHHFAEGAPYVLGVEVSRRSDLVVPAATELRGRVAGDDALVLEVPLAVEVPAGETVACELVLQLRAMACRDGDDSAAAVCEPFTGYWRVPLALAEGGASQVRASAIA